jgi:hypothetical protein
MIVLTAVVALVAVQQGTEAVTVRVNRSALAETQEGTFTMKSVDPYPTGFRVMGFVSGKDQAVHWDQAFSVEEKTPVITRTHVGQEWWVCLGVFMYGNAQQRAETDTLEGQINTKLQLRRTKFTDLATEAAKVNAADDQALAALKTARTNVATLVNAGAVGAEKSAEDALKAGWTNADNAWKAAAASLTKWSQLLGEIRTLDTDLRNLVKNGTIYYYRPAEDTTRAFELHFLDEETATANLAHKVRRELLFVRPQGVLDRITLDSNPAGRVNVTRRSNAERAGNKADVVVLELQGTAQLSADVKDVEIRALVNNEKIKSMPHTNLEYRNLKLARTHDADEDKLTFAYDDAKVVVPDKNLLVYVRGNLFPPASRYASFRNLRDHLRIEIPAVDDSHDAASFVKPTPRRPLNLADKTVATIQFAEIFTDTKVPANKLRYASYNGGGGTGGEGIFVTVFAYAGLPRTSKHFGKKTLKFTAVDIDGATAPVLQREPNLLFTFRKKNRPFVNGNPPLSANCINALWYYSEDGAEGAAAVPGFKWLGITIGKNAITVLHAASKNGEKGTLGETSLNAPRTITFFGTTLADFSVSDLGFHYDFTGKGTITTVVNEIPVPADVSFKLKVDGKRFGPLVAHVWRHELRHAEQFEHLARTGAGDTVDRDGDQVNNLQENANQTSSTTDKTWADFPISTKTAKGDQEVDCELRANGETGVTGNDWAMDTLEVHKVHHRLGTQWVE